MGDAATTVLGSSQLIGIVRFHDGGDVSGAVDALARGGIELLEITIDTPGALRAVERAAGNGRTVGVGTVVSGPQVDECAAAGARFVVSPGLSIEVIERAHELGLEPIPGIFTATELLAAQAAGARIMKLFPASCGGPGYLRALRGPFPTAALVPTGGVRIDEIRAYLDAGATVVALGGELVGRSAPRTDSDLEWIVSQAARATSAARNGSSAAAVTR
jgi:2-dehydro-3-deoxyphosphogluconate aldolase/(4S)-4-hydroxy-2-oxoglutarate aldolase